QLFAPQVKWFTRDHVNTIRFHLPRARSDRSQGEYSYLALMLHTAIRVPLAHALCTGEAVPDFSLRLISLRLRCLDERRRKSPSSVYARCDAVSTLLRRDCPRI